MNTFVNTGIVPLFYNKDAELVKNVVKACYKGGARVFEFTNRGDYAHEVFAEVNLGGRPVIRKGHHGTVHMDGNHAVRRRVT